MIIETMIAVGMAVSHPSSIRVPTPTEASTNSVQHFDKLRNITNRVLDRSIYRDIRRVHTNLVTHEVAFIREAANRLAVQEHCVRRLRADRLPEGECR